MEPFGGNKEKKRGIIEFQVNTNIDGAIGVFSHENIEPQLKI